MPEKADLLYGAKGIAQFLGITTRQAEHLIETRRIPFYKIGRLVAASRMDLIAHLERLKVQPLPQRKKRPRHVEAACEA